MQGRADENQETGVYLIDLINKIYIEIHLSK